MRCCFAPRTREPDQQQDSAAAAAALQDVLANCAPASQGNATNVHGSCEADNTASSHALLVTAVVMKDDCRLALKGPLGGSGNSEAACVSFLDMRPATPFRTSRGSSNILGAAGTAGSHALGTSDRLQNGGTSSKISIATESSCRSSLEAILWATLSSQEIGMATLAENGCLGRRGFEVQTATQLLQQVQQLVWVGNGSTGTGAVYRGVWQGAQVAVKFTTTSSLDLQLAIVNEASLSRLLAHPNVLQTFARSVAFLSASALESVFGCDTANTDAGHMDDRSIGRRYISFKSGEGFGSPYGAEQAWVSSQDVLRIIGARPEEYLVQMIMELCDRASLSQAICKGVFRPSTKWGYRVALRAMLRTAREVAQGMLHLHSHRIVHGDLKPSNVLLMSSRMDRRGFTAKVSDFGLATYCGSSHISVSRWSTMLYMAPEAFDGLLTMASDVYSFGVLLHEMYTGKAPYTGLQPAEIMLGVQQGTLSLTWPEQSDDRIVQLVHICTIHDRSQRPTFAQLISDLTMLESTIRLDSSTALSPPTAAALAVLVPAEAASASDSCVAGVGGIALATNAAAEASSCAVASLSSQMKLLKDDLATVTTDPIPSTPGHNVFAVPASTPGGESGPELLPAAGPVTALSRSISLTSNIVVATTISNCISPGTVSSGARGQGRPAEKGAGAYSNGHSAVGSRETPSSGLVLKTSASAAALPPAAESLVCSTSTDTDGTAGIFLDLVDDDVMFSKYAKLESRSGLPYDL